MTDRQETIRTYDIKGNTANRFVTKQKRIKLDNEE